METPLTWGTNLVHHILRHKILPGAIALDGTMGNGHDTLFLAIAVGEQGKVYSFDIQPIALEATRKRLQEAQIDEERVVLIQDGHQYLDRHVREELDVALFNLGYLPTGDHGLCTRPTTTLTALEATLNRLKRGGLLSIMIYHGHPGGQEEREQVMAFLKALPGKNYLVTQTQTINRSNHPPLLILVERIK